jgi:sporulation protein YlmC with PRC-barrel domain
MVLKEKKVHASCMAKKGETTQMKTALAKTSALLFALALASGTGLAQQTTQPRTQDQRPATQQRDSDRGTLESGWRTPDPQITVPEGHAVHPGQRLQSVRASQLIGANLESTTGDNLGDINDLVLDPQTGQIQFAVLGIGGFLGIGERLTPVPWQAIDVRGERSFVLNVDRQKLEAAPSIQRGQWNELQQPGYVERLYTYYGMETPTAVGRPGQPGVERGVGERMDEQLQQRQQQLRQQQQQLQQQQQQNQQRQQLPPQ